jgi:hypothetical protein
MVCRFKRAIEGGCFNEDICRCYLDRAEISKVSTRRKGKENKKGKQGTAGDLKLNREYTTSGAHISIVRNYLRQWQSRGKLSENQASALDIIGSTKTRDLSDGHREQLLSIFNDAKKGKE